MKTIDTLVEDIQNLFNERKLFEEQNILDLGHSLADVMQRQLNEKGGGGQLRMSNLGKHCNRHLWYIVNAPKEGLQLPPAARMKFFFGHVLEEMLLFLAAEAGHTVEGRQDRLEIDGIQGHRDAIIDGMLVDVKSASTQAFKKFKAHLTHDQDDFGYIQQINAYLEASQDDPRLKVKDKCAFLVIDKTLGHIHLDIHEKAKYNVHSLVRSKKEAVALPEPPARGYTDVPEGKSGNRRLGTVCGYCEYRFKCWPNIRTFMYSNKPMLLTHVERVPNVPEVKNIPELEEDG